MPTNAYGFQEHATDVIRSLEPYNMHGIETREGYGILQPKEAKAGLDTHKLSPMWRKH